MTSPAVDREGLEPAECDEIEWVSRRSRHIAKAIKGLLLALAAALALELTLDAGTAALGLTVTAIGVLAADLYEHAVQREVETGRRIDRREARALAGHAICVLALKTMH